MSLCGSFTTGSSEDWLVIIGSYGATMVLVFGAPGGPFSQPRNVILGQVIASLIAVGCRLWIAIPMGNVSIALPVSVTLSYILMHFTKTLNPPAGGTAAIGVGLGNGAINQLGWGLPVIAALWGVVFVIIACIFINLIPGQRYPKYWFVEQTYFDRCCTCCCENPKLPQEQLMSNVTKHQIQQESGNIVHRTELSSLSKEVTELKEKEEERLVQIV